MTKARNAAKFIVESRRANSLLCSIPEDIRPRTSDEGYAVQEVVHSMLGEGAKRRRVGYKIGCTTPVMQENLSIDHPCAGSVSDTAVYRDYTELAIKKFVSAGVECEIGMVLACDVRPADGPFDRKNISSFIDAVMPAIEIVDNRYQGGTSIGVPTLIADDFFGSGAVLGPENRAWSEMDLSALTGRIFVDGEMRDSGVGSSVMGNPLEAVIWFANMKAKRGEILKKGEFILTGSLTVVQWIESACEVTAEIEKLGTVRLTFN
jgi:2-oxo-3-hexenedioate decarboxylase/2-keto-4-pentenoate hydratase